MDREQEAVMRITARYVAEVQAGLQPRLDEYLARYPQYADEIVDFVAYYQAVEADIPPIIDAPGPLSDTSRIALQRAKEHLARSAARPAEQIPTLLITANKKRLTPSQLATRLGLSVDIIELLEQRKIDPSTLPHEVCRRLAQELHRPTGVIEAYLNSTSQAASFKRNEKPPQLKVAEEQARYPERGVHAVRGFSFRQALEASTQLPEAQKRTWLDILSDEGL
jgi:transcriptional regulator with XRE-family HTH domain